MRLSFFARFKITASDGKTKKKINIPETLWEIERNADIGSLIFNKLIFIGLLSIIRQMFLFAWFLPVNYTAKELYKL